MRGKNYFSFINILIFISGSLWNLSSADFNLTKKEQNGLNEHPVLRLGVGTSFAPIQFVEENKGNPEYKGIASDYINLLSEMLNVKMEVTYVISFSEALELSKENIV